MVGLSKILTVSYGTFSCTLEGFDESFDTMKDIAEYFRDLAADDRYFGAEPPTPDEDMLSRIAEQEISRRVETRSQSSAMVLSAAAAAPIARVSDEAPPPAADTSEDAASEDIVDRFQNTPSAATAIAGEDTSGPETGAALQEASSLLAQSGPEVTASAPEQSAPLSDGFAAMSAGADAPGFDAVPAHPDADSVAAKLQRIRAVVGRGGVDLTAGESTDDLSDEIAGMPRVRDLDVEKPEETQIVSEVASDSRETDENLAVQEPQEVVAEAVSDEPEVDFDNLVSNLATDSVISEKGSEAESSADDSADELVLEASDLVESNADAVPTADDSYEDEQDSADSAEPSPVLARVVRMKRSEYDAALREGEFEAQMPEGDGEGDVDDLADMASLDGAEGGQISSLTDEAEADLLNELAAVERDAEEAAETSDAEAEAEADVAEAPVEAEAETEAETESDPSTVSDPGEEHSARDLLEGDTDEAAMSRLMSQTDAELNEPEGTRRRQAIAQLKAAVAATEAARQLGDDNDPNAEAENAFRDDLDQVVRPRRASLSGERTERPRPAPLKLVASQRVDLATEDNSEPVSPRRVKPENEVAEPTAQESDESFGDYAKTVGASALPELLEAAASHATFVEGFEEFSRIYLMKKVRRMSETKFSREDEMRHFGKLLRQGKITKLGSGRFQVTDQTRFRPEAQAAQG